MGSTEVGRFAAPERNTGRRPGRPGWLTAAASAPHASCPAWPPGGTRVTLSERAAYGAAE